MAEIAPGVDDLVLREHETGSYPILSGPYAGWADRDILVNGAPRIDVLNIVYQEQEDGTVTGEITVPIFKADEFCSDFFALTVTTTDPEIDDARRRAPIVDAFVECRVHARRTDLQAPGSSPATIEIRGDGNTVNVSKRDQFMLDVATRTLLFTGRSAWRPCSKM